MKNQTAFWHEKLDVYNQSLIFFAQINESIVEKSEQKVAAIDHLYRASESILENIVNGNSQWSAGNKSRYFNVAYGSALECAACLDICHIKKIISQEKCYGDKTELQRICQMIVGLLRSQNNVIKENEQTFQYGISKSNNIFFNHEKLKVYQNGLKFISWVNGLSIEHELSPKDIKKLDILSTSIVLNIAEGNGRFGFADHRSFIDISHRAALKTALFLDILKVRKIICSGKLEDGKKILNGIVNMLLGIRGYLDKGKNALIDYERDYEQD